MPSLLSKRWRQLKNSVLLRPVPHTIVSWRFLLPGQDQAVKLHRKVFLRAWPTLSRPAWALIAIYSTTTWLCFFSWLQLYRAFSRHSQQLRQQQGIPRGQQLRDLLRLAFLHHIPPGNYYQYSLFNQPGRKWLHYIYTFQLAQWHSVMSVGASETSKHLLACKHDFSLHMQKVGLPAIKTIQFLSKGQALTSDQLFRQQSLFLKPDTGHQKIGCYELHYQAENEQYRLITADVLTDKNDILDFLNKQILLQDYLIQPLIRNHPDISACFNTDTLVTLRLVTGIVKHQPVILFATLELPIDGKQDTVCPLLMDVQTGGILHDADNSYIHSELRTNLVNQFAGQVVPFWQQSIDTVFRAHQQLQDIPTIGWDIIISPEGLYILEGNSGWAVITHQRWVSQPLLDGILEKVYI